jgi:isoquinoline 1-oxidoreductase alpha subunit
VKGGGLIAVFVMRVGLPATLSRVGLRRIRRGRGEDSVAGAKGLRAFSEGSVIRFDLNGEPAAVDVDREMPILWVLRDVLGLTGTKFGCGIGQCGACTVHLEGQPIRSCLTPMGSAEGRAVTTIEGLDAAGEHPLQRAWIARNVPQCGYCQSGQLMSAAALIERSPDPTPGDIDQAMAGNICRCGTYDRIRAAIRDAADEIRARPERGPSRASGESSDV